MPRPGARRELARWQIVRRQPSSFSVEAVDEHFIQPEIGSQCEAATGIEADRMGMGTSLTLGVGDLPFMLYDGRRLPQAAVVLDGKHSDVAPQIIRHQREFSLAIDRDVARGSALRRLLIERLQPARRRINGKGAHPTGIFHAAPLLDFIDGIQEAPRRIDGQERWLDRGCHARDRQLACRQIEFARINPLALAAGIGADKDDHLGRRHGGRVSA